MPALPLFAQLRRFTLAVLGAAETAADFAGVLYTDAPANGEADAVEPMDLVELEAPHVLTVLRAAGDRARSTPSSPRRPTREFKKEILNEIARCLNMPFNVAAGNSSGYNYASGRLDHQTYYKSIRVDQHHIESVALDRVLRAWLDEAVLVSGFLPRRPRTAAFRDLTHQWFWDGQEHVDPAKEASAQQMRLANNTTTLAAEFAKQGRDWEAESAPAGQGTCLDGPVGTDAHAHVAAGNHQSDRPDQQCTRSGGRLMKRPPKTTEKPSDPSRPKFPDRSTS